MIAHWGTETWYQGLKDYPGQLGDGRDVIIYRVIAGVSGTAQNGADSTANHQRQALAILTYTPRNPYEPVSTIPAPTGSNNEMDYSIWMLNPKVMGLGSVAMVGVYDLGPNYPVVAGGAINLQVQNNGTNPQAPGDALDVEIHQTIVWDYAPVVP